MRIRHAREAPRDPAGDSVEEHPLTAALRRRLCHIIAYRYHLENERHARMAIEIKGLKLQAMTARGHLDRLAAAYAKFNEAAPAHAADVEGMAEQVTEMQSDLEFATNLMGNASQDSERLSSGSEKLKETQVGFAGDLTGPKQQNLPVTIPGAGEDATATFLNGRDIRNEV
jgi:hypothetical protein